MKDGLLIRPVSPAQAPLLAELHAESFGAEAWGVAQIQGSLALDTTQGWTAFAGDAPAGFVLCQVLPDKVEILTFCVCPEYRRRKIGEALMRRVVEDARKNGAAKILLEVAADNAAARGLYERLGFETLGARTGYYRRGPANADAVMLCFSVAGA